MKTDNQLYLRFIADSDLEKDEVKRLFHLISSMLPTGIAGSLPVERPGFGLAPVRLVHKTDASGAHVYEIPLTRHLTDTEFQYIDEHLAQDEQHVELQKSAAPIANMRQVPAGEPQIEPGPYDIFCDTLAKLQHARWCSERNNEGWRYGTTYSAADRVSPLLLPWHDLPPQYQKVDKSFPQEILQILESMGYLVVPRDKLEKMLKRK